MNWEGIDSIYISILTSRQGHQEASQTHTLEPVKQELNSGTILMAKQT